MLRFMHKYRRSVFGIILIGLVSLAMSGFGVDMMRENRDGYAIKIDEHLISYDDYYRERRELEQRYKMIFGENFAELSKQLNLNMGQQTTDKLIADYLIEREARSLGMTIGPNEVSKVITTQLFGGKFDPNMYAQFLRQMGMSSQVFEEKVRSDALRQAFAALLRGASVASEGETRAALRREETSYSLEFVEFDPTTYAKQVKEPSTEELQAYLEANSSRFEQPERIKYDYLVLDPAKFLDLVKITPDDVELYYTDNQSEFMRPEAVQAKHIQFTYSKTATPEEMAKLKEKAKAIHEKVVAGEPFDSLALQNSDDLTTKTLGGDLGWLERGKMDKAFDAAVFQAKAAGVPDLVETAYGFHVVKIEAYREAAPRSLDDVRAKIETLLKQQEAPAYTSERAHQLFEEWKKSTLTLAELAAQNGLAAASTNGLLAATTDPEAGLKGLTSQVINSPDDLKQIVDVGEKVAIVAIKEFRPNEVPELATVRAAVLEAFRQQESKKLARAAAETFSQKLASEVAQNLRSLAQAQKLEVKSAKELKKSTVMSNPPFQDTAIQKLVFSSTSPRKLSGPLEAFGKFYAAEVVAIALPDEAVIGQKLADSQKRESQELAQLLASSLNSTLKAKAVIDVAPGLAALEE
jgi:peptidyl-prolyl cis-trans isomerase D